MRYAIIAMGRPLLEVEQLVKQHGGSELRTMPRAGQVFATLEPEQAQRLSQLPGLVVHPVQQFRHQQVLAPQAVATQTPTTLSPLFKEFQNAISPPLYGSGWTIAILDSGIRKTHLGLKDKVVYEANFSEAPTPDDVFDHGTGVAYLAAGGTLEGDSGMAPGALLINIKVMDDQGQGTDETVVAGLEEVGKLHDTEPPDSPKRPRIVNLSLGSPDTGNPNSPVRVAARRMIMALDLVVTAAVGNGGPAPGTILEPASEPWVVGVGAMTIQPWQIWEQSSRGPTKEGVVKPDLVFYGVDLLTASSKGDDAYVLKAGTSFAAPIIAGLDSLAEEYFLRQGIPPTKELGRSIMPLVCQKPPAAPAAQDNDYGFGIPSPDLVARVMKPPALIPIQEIMSLLSLGLVMGMVGSFSRALRRR